MAECYLCAEKFIGEEHHPNDCNESEDCPYGIARYWSVMDALKESIEGGACIVCQWPLVSGRCQLDCLDDN